jgi:hypothetical protein
VYRQDESLPDSQLELAQLGGGDVIGELAPILGKLRNATVEPSSRRKRSKSRLASLQHC